MTTKDNLTAAELYAIATRMCALSEHCVSEVRAKLQRSSYDNEEIESVLARLVQERYLDEARYAQAFINDKLRFAKWGRRKIQQELWRKEIPAAIYQPIFDEMDEEEYLQTMRDLLAAKRRSVKGRTDYEVRMKLARFLQSRGYEMQFIQQALRLDEDD